MVFTRHLGVKGGTVKRWTGAGVTPSLRKEMESDDPKSLHIWDEVHEVMALYRDSELLRVSAVYRFFRAFSEGNRLNLFQTGRKKRQFLFPRQSKIPYYCISDFVHPDPLMDDNVAVYAVTVGKGLQSEVERLKGEGQYLRSHILQVIALESAEAYAELLHAQFRRIWGFPDPDPMTMLQRFQAKYRGKRYSFGYPACPELSDQSILFDLLQPEEIGLQLTDGFMMEPEASVSALAFHHPDAVYFSVGNQEESSQTAASSSSPSVA